MHHHASDWPLMWPLLVVEVVIFGCCSFGLLVSRESADFEKRSLSLVRGLAAGYLVYAPWVMVEQIATMAGTTPKEAIAMIPMVLRESHVGHVWLARLVVFAMLLVVAWLPAPEGAKRILNTSLAVTLLAVRSWGSHAIDKGVLSVAVYTVHEVAAGLWLGSLCGLLLASVGIGFGRDAFSEAAERASLIAGWCVAILIATGLFNAYQELGINLSLLRYSAYGRVILFKLATAAMVIAIGAYNRFKLIPSIDILPAQSLLRRNVAIECVILLGVLYWSAILANTPPPH